MMDREAILHDDGEITVRGVDYGSKLLLHCILNPSRIVVKWRGGSYGTGFGPNRYGTTLEVWNISDVQQATVETYQGTKPVVTFHFANHLTDIPVKGIAGEKAQEELLARVAWAEKQEARKATSLLGTKPSKQRDV